MDSYDGAGADNLIHLNEARSRRERSGIGKRFIDLSNFNIDETLHAVLSRRLDAIVAKSPDAVIQTSLSIVNGVLELMGRDRAEERAKTNEALATLIIMMAAARATAVELIPEALRRCFDACGTCKALHPGYDAQTPYYGRVAGDDRPTLETLCATCQPIYRGLDGYAREARALGHVEGVSDEAVRAARVAFFAGSADYTGEDERMRAAVRAAVRVLKATPIVTRA
jgi:hypothetical protein